jgi:putative redox protein
MTQVNTVWKNNMSFEATINNHTLMMDGDEAIGGNDSGMRPKPLMLAALAGCTGIDVVSILNKMRVPFSDFNVDVTAEMNDGTPKVFTAFHVIYKIKVAKTDRDKVVKAVTLSDERYCGVSAMYKSFATVTHEIIYTN